MELSPSQLLQENKGISSEIKDICKPAPPPLRIFRILESSLYFACIFIGCQDFLVDFAPLPISKTIICAGD